MNRYKVAGPVVHIIAGLVRLSAEQARARAHRLIPVEIDNATGAGVYEVNGEIQLKRGEEFEHDGDLPKALAADLAEIEDDEKPRRRGRRKKSEVEAPASETDAPAEADGDEADDEGGEDE